MAEKAPTTREAAFEQACADLARTAAAQRQLVAALMERRPC